jgi:hypothetical protein
VRSHEPVRSSGFGRTRSIGWAPGPRVVRGRWVCTGCVLHPGCT